eukprot:7724139-Pyramimonas_sp.AAC.1
MDARAGEILEEIDIDEDATASYSQRGLDKSRDIVVEMLYAATRAEGLRRAERVDSLEPLFSGAGP